MDNLAVLLADQLADPGGVLLQQLLEAEHDPRALSRQAGKAAWAAAMASSTVALAASATHFSAWPVAG
ncbi:hypothetical protein GCM10027514_25330 [Azotobacter armeniacus]